MTTKFTTPCFIRKNTPELRKKLEELGYNHAQNVWEDKHINKCRLLWTEYYGSYWHHYIEARPKKFFDTHIDCGENEQLFLALAALRDDSDKFQWFCDDEEEYKSLFFCKYDDVEQHIHNEMDGWDCEGFHKATPEELIKHFNKE